ncbi:MAG: SPFH domain-containing protein [Clostridia bacterium]|nr:SPFH domain-containing protein [Clostridia bacterium]
MALFSKHDKTPKGQPIISIIEYDGPHDVLLWRYPHEDFNTNAQLIVGPTQEAIFVKGGKVYDKLPSGTHTLSTENYPFIRNLIGVVTRGVSPFACQVYYVNKAVSMGAQWGTDSPISLIDPLYSVPVEVVGNGEFALQVTNGHMLLERLVGQGQGWTHEEVRKYFSSMMGMEIRSVISRILQEKGLSCIGVDAMLPEIAAAATERLAPIFEPYGMALRHFSINKLKARNLGQFTDKSIELQIRRMDDSYRFEQRRGEADTKRYEADVTGVTQQQRWVHELGMKIVENPGTTVNAIGGMQPIVGCPGMVGVPGTPVTTINTKNTEATANAGLEIGRMLLNQQGGGQTVQAPEAAAGQPPTLTERVQALEMMQKSGLLSPEEYEKIRQELLQDILKGGAQG